jgi:hypothetical protein
VLWWIARASPEASIWISTRFIEKVRKIAGR